MIQSMTGYGKSVLHLPNKKITIELKSLNSRSIDIKTRIPSTYREKELELRNLIASKLMRGKIDFSFQIEETGERTPSQINIPVIKNYINQLKDIADTSDSDLLQMAIGLPDAVVVTADDIDQNEWSLIMDKINLTLNKIETYRREEGTVLETDFIQRTAAISKLLDQVIAIDPERIKAVRARLLKAIEDLKAQVDENRFEQELIYYIEKYDITEEKLRLKNHLDYFNKTLSAQESNGKKLGFITQEIGREINTIGSKSNYAPMQKLVIQMKDELEKIKEQLLNVL